MSGSTESLLIITIYGTNMFDGATIGATETCLVQPIVQFIAATHMCQVKHVA